MDEDNKQLDDLTPVKAEGGVDSVKQIKEVKAAIRELGAAGERAAKGMSSLNDTLAKQTKSLAETSEELSKLLKEFRALSSESSKVELFNYTKGKTKTTKRTKKATKSRSVGNRKSSDSQEKITEKQRKKEQKQKEKKEKLTGEALKSLSKGNIKGAVTPLLQLGKQAPKLTAASSALLGAVGVVGALAGVVGVLAKAGIDASKSSTQVAKALNSVGKEAGVVEKRGLSVQNSLNSLSNKLGNLLKIGGDIINIVLEPLLDILDKITGGLDSSDLDDKVGKYSLGVTSSAQQSGFDLNSSESLAVGTYKLAQQINETTGEKAYEVAEKLADAWLNGSDAAKEYGIVVNDTVLAGYMASKGIDIVNTEITDAMRQYYRYQLLTEEVNTSNKKALQDQIKQWTQLGLTIEKTKGKLFSFDEVINLEGFDTTIPEVENQGSLDSIIGGGTPSLPKPPDNSDIPNNPSFPGFNTLPTEPVLVAIEVAVEGMELIAQLQEALSRVPALETSKVALQLELPQLEEALGLLRELQERLNNLPASTESNVTVGIPQLEDVKNLWVILTTLPLAIMVNIASMVKDFPLVQDFKELLTSIPVQVATTIACSIPAIGLVNSLYQLVTFLNNSFNTNIDIGVYGQELLNQAYSTLENIKSVLSSIGSELESSLSPQANTAQRGGYKNRQLKEYAPSSLIGAYSPTTSIDNSVYGSGLLGALSADLDVNLTRLGIKDETRTGLSSNQLNSALLNQLGYNTDIKNSGSLAQALAVTGLVGAAGYGAISAAPIVGSVLGGVGSKVASTGAGLLSSGAGALGNAVSGITNFVEGLGSLGYGMAAYGFANGGIGTKEIHNASLFEGDKKEAVIPLESQSGIDFLANAMEKAGGYDGGGGDNIIVNISLDGLNIADNEESWQRVGEKIAEIIDIQKQRRGELNYGGAF